MAFYFYTADKGAALAHGDGGRGLVGLRGLGAFPLGPPATSEGFRSVFPRRPAFGGEPKAPPFRGTPAQYFCHCARGTALKYELVSWDSLLSLGWFYYTTNPAKVKSFFREKQKKIARPGNRSKNSLTL